MSITPAGLKAVIAEEMSGLDQNTTPDDAQNAMAKAIVNYLKDNLTITIPPGTVIAAVTGGSGAPAIGVPNVPPITLNVS